MYLAQVVSVKEWYNAVDNLAGFVFKWYPGANTNTIASYSSSPVHIQQCLLFKFYRVESLTVRFIPRDYQPDRALDNPPVVNSICIGALLGSGVENPAYSEPAILNTGDYSVYGASEEFSRTFNVKSRLSA
jgi:hypothetical protein